MANREIFNLIGNEWVRGHDGLTVPVLSPSTGEEIARSPKSGQAEFLAAAQSAQKSFPTWSATDFAERAVTLRALASGIAQRGRDLAQFEAMSQGQPMELGLNLSVPWASKAFTTQATALENDHAREIDLDVRSAAARLTRTPRGPVLLMISDSMPVVELAHSLATILASGCTCVVIAPPNAPMTTYMLAEIALKADLPPGTCSFILSLNLEDISWPSVEAYFTAIVGDSTNVPKSWVQAVGSSPVKSSVRLQKNNVMLILDDTNWHSAIEAAVRGVLLNQGQTPVSLSHILVRDDLYDRWAADLVAALRCVHVDDPLDRRSFMGPVVSAQRLAEIQRLLQAAIDAGAKNMNDQLRPPGLREEFAGGHFIAPQVLGDLPTDHAVFLQPLAGPVARIARIKDDRTGVAVANSLRPRAVVCACLEARRIERLQLQLKCEFFWQNEWMLFEPHVSAPHPFGLVSDPDEFAVLVSSAKTIGYLKASNPQQERFERP
jgi:acyl-CoA reductase-like NAD-dependent aldehyde dehydrogenase